MTQTLATALMALFCALLIGSPSQAHEVPAPECVCPKPAPTIKTTAALLTALKTAKSGDTITLAPSTYAGVIIKATRFDGAVTIQGKGATFTDLLVRDSQGLRFGGMTLAVQADGEPNQFTVYGSKNVHFDQIVVQGPAAKPLNGKGGLMLRLSTDVSVTGSKFRGTQHGLTILDNVGVKITGNDFRNIQTDGVRGGGTSELVITDNAFTDFFPLPGEHPDAIQLWTTNTKASAKNILIARNQITRGRGAVVQGIFLRDQVKTLPYIDVAITDNLVLGTLWNGLFIEGGQNVEIARNQVIGFPDQKTFIRYERVAGLKLSDNAAQDYEVAGVNTAVIAANNATVAAVKDQGAKALTTWRAAR